MTWKKSGGFQMNGKLLCHAALLASLVAGAAVALEGRVTVGNIVEPASLLPSPTDTTAHRANATAGLADIDGAALAIKTVASAGYQPPATTRLN